MYEISIIFAHKEITDYYKFQCWPNNFSANQHAWSAPVQRKEKNQPGTEDGNHKKGMERILESYFKECTKNFHAENNIMSF